MKFVTTNVGGTVEFLASTYFKAIPVEVAAADGADSTVVKGGTPLTAEGASTTGANAVGILLYDVDTAENPNGALLVDGVIDSTKAQAHSGVTYADGLAAALSAAGASIVMRTNIGVNT